MTEGWSAQHYSQRLKAGGMGDEAESKFEEVTPDNEWVRFGFNRPPFRMTHLTSFIRHAPDYVTKDGTLVECMGMGRDGRLKLKEEKFDALDEWNDKQPVSLFVWNSAKQEHVTVTFGRLEELYYEALEFDGMKSFNDGNKYVPISWAGLCE